MILNIVLVTYSNTIQTSKVFKVYREEEEELKGEKLIRFNLDSQVSIETM